MKPRVYIVFLAVALLLAVSGQTAWAGESWTTDPKSGAKIGIVTTVVPWTLTAAEWTGPVVNGFAEGTGSLMLTIKDKDGKSYIGNGEVEMRAGLMDGKVSMKWSDGEVVEGYYKAGLLEQGSYRYADGRVYEGTFKNGQPDGYGVGKNKEGKVVHDGQWKDGMPFIPLKADKVLGIPWGAKDDEVRKIMLKRPGTQYLPDFNGKDSFDRWHFYSGPYAEFSDAWIYVHFYQDKMWMVQISWPLKEEEALARFKTIKQGLTGRYGNPSSEEGTGMDSFALWDLSAEYAVNVQIRKNTIKLISSDPTPQTHPYRVFVTYYSYTISKLYYEGNKPSASPDY